MIKRGLVIIGLLTTLVVSGCSSNEVKQEESMQREINTNNGGDEFYCEKTRQSGEAIYEGDIISDADTALDYADMIMKNVLHKNVKNYKEVYVENGQEKGIWVVTYGIDKYSAGGDISIAIDKTTGQILLISFGE